MRIKAVFLLFYCFLNLYSFEVNSYYKLPFFGAEIELSDSFACIYFDRTIQIVNTINTHSPYIEDTIVVASGINELKIKNNFIFICSDTGLIILQKNENGLSVVATYDSSCLNTMDIYENYAFIGNSKKELLVLDISNTKLPVVKERTINQFGNIESIKIAGNQLFIHGSSDSNNCLYIVNVVNPEKPVKEGFITYPGHISGFTTNGEHAVLYEHEQLWIFDISNPFAPYLTGLYRFFSGIWGIEILGNDIYAANGKDGIQCVDISNPALPLLEGGFDTPCEAISMRLAGENAFVCDKCGLLIVNTKEPANTIIGDTLILPYITPKIKTHNNFLYVVTDTNWTIFNNQTPSLSLPVGSSLFVNQQSFNKRNSRESKKGGIFIYELNNPSSPKYVSAYASNAVSDLEISGNQLFALDYYRGLEIIDISNPVNPLLIGSLDSLFAYKNMILSKNYLYMTSYLSTAMLLAINVSNPKSPFVEGRIRIGKNYTYFLNGLTISGNYAYVCAENIMHDDALYIIDISNPAQMKNTGFYDLLHDPFDIEISGDFAYVACGKDGLTVLDVRSPSSPTLVGKFATPGNAVDIKIQGNYLFVADGCNLIPVFDISNPWNVKRYGTVYTNQGAISLDTKGNYLYSAEGLYGVSIIPLDSIVVSIKKFANGDFIIDENKMAIHYSQYSNNSITISFTVPDYFIKTNSNIQLTLRDMKGRIVNSLFDGKIYSTNNIFRSKVAGDGKNHLSNGVYFVTLLINGRGHSLSSFVYMK